jgi:hypothetical protein
MDYNDELPTTTLNCLGNAVLPFLFSLLPSTLQFFTPVGTPLNYDNRLMTIPLVFGYTFSLEFCTFFLSCPRRDKFGEKN